MGSIEAACAPFPPVGGHALGRGFWPACIRCCDEDGKGTGPVPGQPPGLGPRLPDRDRPDACRCRVHGPGRRRLPDETEEYPLRRKAPNRRRPKTGEKPAMRPARCWVRYGEQLSNPASSSSFGRNKGTVFPGSTPSPRQVWSVSVYRARNGQTLRSKMDRTANDIVSRIKEGSESEREVGQILRDPIPAETQRRGDKSREDIKHALGNAWIPCLMSKCVLCAFLWRLCVSAGNSLPSHLLFSFTSSR